MRIRSKERVMWLPGFPQIITGDGAKADGSGRSVMKLRESLPPRAVSTRSAAVASSLRSR